MSDAVYHAGGCDLLADMTLHASWVHGNAVRPEWVGDHLRQVAGDRWDSSSGDIAWSDINGLPRGWGVTYRCANSLAVGLLGASTAGPFHPETPFEYSLKGYWFHIPVPTPVIVGGVRAQLQRVFVLWTATGDLGLAAIHVWDGAQRIATLGAGTQQSADQLIPGSTQFDLPASHSVAFGISISVGVSCTTDSDVTFHSAGADFEV